MSTEINKLNDSIPKLQTIKNNVDHNLVTSAKKEVENVKRKKPADLIKLPARRQLNPGYILSLYEVIDTNQVSTLGEAIKVVEDRFERAELNQQLKMQIAESQKELQKTIGQGLNEVNNNLADLGTTVKKSTREIGRGLKQTNNQLMRVNDNINELSNNVIGSAQNIEAAIIASNNTDKEISDTLRVIEQNNVEYARKSQQMIAVSQNGHKQII